MMITQKSRNFLPGRFPMRLCLFHAVFVIIVREPNTFFEDLLHPLVIKLFLQWKIYVEPASSW